MAVNYSLVLRPSIPSDKNSEPKVYPVAQMAKQVTLRDIAQHIHDHGSPFSVGTIVGLLLDTVQCIVENLREGNRVDMDTLGDFFLTLSAVGADSAADFNPATHVKHINLRWRTTEAMDQALQHIGFNHMPTLDELSEVKRQSKAKIDSQLHENGEALATDPDDSGDPGDVTG